MLEKNVITKIALGVAAAAFIFSLITLIRAIIIGVGVPFAAIQVIGTLIIVAICAIMLYVLRTEEPEADEEAPAEEASEEPAEAPEENTVTDTENIEPDVIHSKYDFESFE